MPKKVITETRLYPILLHREEDVWGYFSPDFGGGGGAPSQEEALSRAFDLMKAQAADLCEKGEEIPKPSLAADLNADGGQVAWLPITVTNAAQRIFLTMPTSLLAQIDAVTDNRSAFFAELARERLVHRSDQQEDPFVGNLDVSLKR